MWAWLRGHLALLWLVPALVLVIGATRVYLGVHWATDVVAGWLLGVAWVLVCVAVARSVGRHAPAGRSISSPERPWRRVAPLHAAPAR